ncbi:MAG: alpha/beta hydrolase fold domain-containing protein, partial [Nocardioides sp.]|nr:alpha/beta hydrolase fold domain-containing protein [Nocardioides sp.]
MGAREALSAANGVAEAVLLRAAMGLPERVQAKLAGPPVVLDGQTLAPETQLTLRMQRLARLPGAETLPIAQGRAAVAHHAGLAAGDQPVGAVRDFLVGDLPARLYTPTSSLVEEGAKRPSRNQLPLLVFFHGGGFMYGDLESHDAPCRVLAERGRVRVLAIDY